MFVPIIVACQEPYDDFDQAEGENAQVAANLMLTDSSEIYRNYFFNILCFFAVRCIWCLVQQSNVTRRCIWAGNK